MANKRFSDVAPEKGVGTTKSIKSSGKGEPKGDPKFTAAPDNAKKNGFGYGNSAKNHGRGAANRD